MEVDHIFIFSSDRGREVDELLDFGLMEGSGSIHEGQGTRSRKIYFENFFLEIAWVDDESQINSELTSPTGLCQRAMHPSNGFSPFGLCLVNSIATDELFNGCLKYHPNYLQEGPPFEIITNADYPSLPWMCRLPSTREHFLTEPKSHRVGIKELSAIKFGIRPDNDDCPDEFTNLLAEVAGISFHPATSHLLTLEFDHKANNATKQFQSIPLIIAY